MITVAHNSLVGPDTDDFAELIDRCVSTNGTAPEQLMDAVIYTSAYYDARGVTLSWAEIGRQYVKAHRVFQDSTGYLELNPSQFISIEWSRQQ